jgi:putative transposase
MGVSEATYYRWKQLYGGLGPSELRKMRQLEEENQKLKRLVADLSLEKAMLQEVWQKKCSAWSASRDRPSGAGSISGE